MNLIMLTIASDPANCDLSYSSSRFDVALMILKFILFLFFDTSLLAFGFFARGRKMGSFLNVLPTSSSVT
jgi:hypothetical protein